MYEKEERNEVYRKKLMAYREKMGYSREQLGQVLDVTRQTIYNWENGKYNIIGAVRLYLDVME